jgi:hypothetical protein
VDLLSLMTATRRWAGLVYDVLASIGSSVIHKGHVMFRVTIAVIALTFAGCCAEKPSMPTRLSSATELARIKVNMDGNDNLSIGGGLTLLPADLPLFAKEAGTDRPVVLYGFDLKKLIQVKQEFQSAGFKNVVIGAAVGE